MIRIKFSICAFIISLSVNTLFGADFWTEKVAVTESPNGSITCTSDADYAGHAYSVASIPADRDGYFEFTVNNCYGMVGITSDPQGGGYASIDYAFQLWASATLNIMENSVTKRSGTAGSWSTGDLLRIEKTGTTIKYYRNSALLYTSTLAVSSALYADFAFGGTNTGFNAPVLYVAPGFEPPLGFWTQKVFVTESSNGSVVGNSADNFASYAYSVNHIAVLGDGYFEFTVNNCFGSVGLNSDPQGASFLIDYAFDFTNNNILNIREDGLTKWSGNIGSWAKGDVLKIEKTGVVIKYYRNNTLLYTSTVKAIANLYADFMFNGIGTGFDAPKLFLEPIVVPLGFWTSEDDVIELSDSSIICTSDVSYSGQAHSVDSIPTDRDGYFEFRINNSFGIIGLGSTPTDNSGISHNIDYGFGIWTGGLLNIKESGVDKWGSQESWIQGDILKVEKRGSFINYYRNNNLLYTSTVTSGPLYADFLLGGINTGLDDPKLVLTPLVEPPAGFWTEKVFVTESSDGSITTSSTAFQAHAYSVGSIPAGRDGYFEFKINNCNGRIGLNSDPQGGSIEDIDLAFQISAGNAVVIIENGEAKWSAPGAWTPGDVLKIERTGIFIKYYRNGTVLYTTIRSISNTLYADFTIGGGNMRFDTPVLYVAPPVDPPLGFWTEKVFVTESSDGSISGVSNENYAGHAYSVASIPADKDGYFQFTVNNCYGMIGLTSDPIGGGYEQIDYAIQLWARNSVNIMENGITKLEGADGSWSKGDILKIEKKGTAIKYYKNGILFYSSTISVSSALYADFAFGGANTGFDTPLLILDPPSGFWTEKVSVTESPNSSITCTSNDDYAGHAYSVQSIPAGQDGYFEFTVNNCAGVIGLTSDPVGGGYVPIDYAFQLSASNTISIMENGVTKSRGNDNSWAKGDLLKIERNGSTIKYYKNTVLLYISTVPATATVYADFAFGGANTGFDAPVLYVGNIEDPKLDPIIYNFVTANSDGKNDYFFIEDLPKVKQHHLYIFDRYNNIVFHTTDYKNDWNGSGLESGTYFYRLSYDGEEKKDAIFLSK